MPSELQSGEVVSLTILGQPEAQPTAPARIVSTAGRRITASTELPVELGRAVQIQSAELLILAEVIAIQAAPGTIVLQVRHALQTNAIEDLQQQWR
jgi:hypothetical protein